MCGAGFFSTTLENLPAVGEGLRAIVEALVKTLHQATSLPVTQHVLGDMHALEADEEEMDDGADDFLDTLLAWTLMVMLAQPVVLPINAERSSTIFCQAPLRRSRG